MPLPLSCPCAARKRNHGDGPAHGCVRFWTAAGACVASRCVVLYRTVPEMEAMGRIRASRLKMMAGGACSGVRSGRVRSLQVSERAVGDGKLGGGAWVGRTDWEIGRARLGEHTSTGAMGGSVAVFQ